MKRPRKIAFSNLPMRSPLPFTVLLWLLLDRLQAPGWAWGAAGVVLVMVWISFLIEFFTRDEVDVIK